VVDQKLYRQFQQILGPQGTLVAPQDLSQFSQDASRNPSPPSVVLQPQTTSQVAKIVALAHERRLPIAIRGGGTGLDGGAVAPRDGLLMSLRKMSRIKEISPEDMMAVVQPGLITARMNDQLRPSDLFYPIDPASQGHSTIGGDVATGAHGLRGAKYGSIKNYLLGLEVVTPPGEVIRCGAKTLKCATGYHLTDLFAGSRGRIGVITEIILKLLPRPQARISLMATFHGAAQADRFREVLMRENIWPSRLELLDSPTVEKGLSDLKLDLSPDQVLLLVELDGPESLLKEDIETTLKILAQEGGWQIQRVEDERQAERWWRLRGSLLSALVEDTDVALLLTVIVPASKTDLFFEKLTTACQAKSIDHYIYGHLAEGRWHSVLPAKGGESARIRDLANLAKTIHKMAGSLGARILRPHAIGFNPGTPLAPPGDGGQERLWSALKSRFDPRGIFNPQE
jgi:glycolate oxidase